MGSQRLVDRRTPQNSPARSNNPVSKGYQAGTHAIAGMMGLVPLVEVAATLAA